MSFLMSTSRRKKIFPVRCLGIEELGIFLKRKA